MKFEKIGLEGIICAVSTLKNDPSESFINEINNFAHHGVRVHGEDLQTVDVWFGGPPVLRVLLRSMLPDVLVAAVAYEHHHHDHTADHGAKSEPI